MAGHETSGRAGAADPGLIGRVDERRALTRLLDAIEGATASVVIYGDVGQGKSSLLRWLAHAATQRGMTVAEVTGIEFERGLGFSGLTAVLRPLLDHIDDLGDAQRRALEVALGFAEGDAPRLTTYAATLELLSSATDEAPLLVVADDAQWIDPASLEALVFAAHRCGADRVGFAFAQRAGESCLLDQTGFARITLRGLGRDDAVALLAGREGVDPLVAECCWELSDGNPLALIEGARGLSSEQRSGAEPLPPALPLVERLLERYRTDLSGLPDATVQALGVAALETSDDLGVVASALCTRDATLADLAPAEQRDLVRLAGTRLVWRHPLIRSAAHRMLDTQQRRAAHRALADATLAVGRDEQALWHLSETVNGPDDELAQRLGDLAETARRRGALSAAADAHQQAARLATRVARADEEILQAALAYWGAGAVQRAGTLLRDRIDRVSDRATRARMAILLGQAELWEIGPLAAVSRFERHAADVGDDRPEIAAFLLMHASTARLLALDAEASADAAERAVATAERSGDMPATFASMAIRTLARLFAGREPGAVDQLEAIGQLALAALDERVESADDLVQLCGYGLVVCERWGTALDLLDHVIQGGVAAGMVERTAFARVLRAEALWRTGRWAESLADLTQAQSLQEPARPGLVLPGIAAMLARNDAGLGRESTCRSLADGVLGSTAPGSEQVEHFRVVASGAVGLLELGARRHAAAATAFDHVAAAAGHVTEPGWLWWQADAIEAYVGCGRLGDAREALARLEEQAAATNRGWARAAAARARVLVGESAGGASGTAHPTPFADAADDDLTTALDGFRAVGAPFEEARTLLVRGRCRQRAGASADARRDLAAARAIFDRLGANAWSQQASSARGEAGGSDESLTARLTPAELRVAISVGRGASNREAADDLFISIKTVDYHLQNIYRKLGLRSRTQLAALVVTDARSPA